MQKTKRKYCSLDIETSGFDPLKCEILEVGFAFFEVGEKGIKITQEWTSVFKPTKEVPSQILGLTGITKDELDKAPAFEDLKGEIQDKLGDAIIVGHNVIFDVKFLETFGIKFSGQIVDTLDLVQFLLPTHHSYNLENLMHTFHVSHKDAHRALADSKATLVVLERLLGIYHDFPADLKSQIKALIKGRGFCWEDMLETEIKLSLPKESSHKNIFSVKTDKRAKKLVENQTFAAGCIYNFPLGDNYLKELVESANNSGEKILLVVPKLQQVMEFWKQEELDIQFPSELLFNERKFSSLLKKARLEDDQVKFLLKVLVWKYTNWQTTSVLELNLTFFGGQFKPSIAGGALKEMTRPTVVACDLPTFINLAKAGLYNQRKVLICGLNEFEQQASFNISTKISWGYTGYLLKTVYNPELATGNAKYKDTVIEALSATDLFFGLANGLLRDNTNAFQYFKVTKDAEYLENFQKMKKAAENFMEKLGQFNKQLKLEELGKTIEGLKDFFAEQPNRVKWLELAENRCVFFNSPIDISDLVKDILAPYQEVCFADSLGTDKLLKYYQDRLAIRTFKIESIKSETNPKIIKFLQGDLFHKSDSSKKELTCVYQPIAITEDKIFEMLSQEGVLPAAILFSSTLQIRPFYEKYYEQLKTKASLYVQSASGGSNKIFRNFTINGNGLLLATNKFVLKQLNGQSTGTSIENLPVKTLVICHLPFEQFTHPYQQAVSEQFANPFEDFSLPKAIYNFHSLIKFFNTPALERIYLFDTKLAKSYASGFKDYLMQLPGIKIIEPELVQ